MGIWQKWLGSKATWWNNQIKVNPTQVSEQMNRPVFQFKSVMPYCLLRSPECGVCVGRVAEEAQIFSHEAEVPLEDGLAVTEGVEGVLAVVRPVAARPHAAERQRLHAQLHDEVVDAHRARGRARDYLVLHRPACGVTVVTKWREIQGTHNVQSGVAG